MFKKLIVLSLLLLISVIADGSIRKHHRYYRPIKTRASFYARKFEGRKMTDGTRYRRDRMSAASLTYPLGSILDVFCPSTGKTIIVQVTDHGPYSRKFGIDLSESAYTLLGGAKNKGWMWVEVYPA